MTEATPAALPFGVYPKALWRPLNVNFTPGGNTPRLAIVHIMQGSLTGTDNWFRNPVSQVSAHFGVGKDGQVVQWVICTARAWHAAEANDHSIGIEHEGWSGQPLTDAQLDATAALFEWLHDTFPAIRGWLTSRPASGSGLAWHGLGGVAWGNHPDCPGGPVVAQLGEILATSAGAP